MATLKEAIEYSRKNPQSDFAIQLKQRIQSGQADQDAAKEGVDLSWAGRPKTVAPQVVEKPQSTYQKISSGIRDVSTGFVKGAIEGTVETAKLLQNVGQAGLAAIDPTKTFKEVKATTGFESLKGLKAEEISQQLKSKNDLEKAGKIAEFIVELGWPVGKAEEVASLLRKGKEGILDPLLNKGGEIVEKGQQMVSKGKEFVSEIPSKIKQKVTGVAPVTEELRATDDALSIIRGKVDSKAEELAVKQGRMKTVDTALGKKVVVEPTRQEQLMADSIEQLVKDGRVSPKKLPPENAAEVAQEVSRFNDDIGEFIFRNKAPFNKQQLRSQLNSVKNESKIVFTTDSTLERTYDALIDEFMTLVEKGDTYALFEARQAFDKVPAVKKLLDTAKGSAGENLRRQAVLDIRRAANDFVVELLPPNSPYKAFMKQESQMLQVIENLAEQSKGLTGTNALNRFINKYPSAKKWLPGFITGGIVF